MGNGCPGNNPAASFSSPAVADGGTCLTLCFRDTVIGTILFYAGFLLIIFLFTEEFARVLKWLQARLKRSLWCRIIFYPLLFLLIAAAGFIIVTSLIKFSTTLTFSYD